MLTAVLAMGVGACQTPSRVVKPTVTGLASTSPPVPRRPVLTLIVYGVSGSSLPAPCTVSCEPEEPSVSETEVPRASLKVMLLVFTELPASGAEKLSAACTVRETPVAPLAGVLPVKLIVGGPPPVH